MRAVVVLLLLIANALVSPSNIEPPASAPEVPYEYSLGLLSVIDGAPVGTPRCGVRGAFDGSLAYVAPDGIATSPGRRSAPSLPLRSESRCGPIFQL